MRIRRALVASAVVLAVFSITAGFAQDAPAAPEPTAEHKALGKWVGTWAGTADLKPSPYGPGGQMTWTEDCSWLGGNKFNVVCESKGTSPTGPMVGLGIMGYNPAKKVYTHYGVDSSGWAGYAEGSRTGDTWTYQSEETMEGNTFHSRFKITLLSDTEMKFTWSMSQDGKTWNDLMEGTSKKN